MFCNQCGKNIDERKICPYCEYGKHDHYQALYTAKKWDLMPIEIAVKSRLVAGILQFFLGAFGIGRFYIGDKTIAFLQIAASALTLGFGGFLWGFIDGLMILSGAVERDGKGNILGA